MPSDVEDALFPNGKPRDKASKIALMQQYQLMVQSSEKLVDRRQALNTFYFTVNGAIIAAAGFMLSNGSDTQLQAAGLGGLSFAGLILAKAWWTLLISFGQLNTGKFEVINTLERYLGASIYTAEWVALGEGKDPEKYQSFTEREAWVPRVFFSVYAISLLVQAAIIMASFSGAKLAM
ncbi:RipA family octameric membrane protein [Clavibacter sp. km1a]|uniref:RipA family octameric membrane protein n=1 Tax=Clavibacter sp. km1a TaxID=3459136 RepID=UPI004041671A